jgi:hypothetical protein
MTIIIIIPAYSIPAGKQCGLLTFFCEHCSRWHTHSAQAGHRIAHCQELHYPSGYTLEDAGPLTEEIIKQYPNRRGLPLAYQTAQYQAREKALLHGW